MRKTVVPRSSRRPRMCCHRLARACGSSPVVGSSRKTSSGHVDQPDDDVQPAPLATGERLGLALPQAVEVELAEQLLAALGRLGGAHPVQPGVVDDLLARAGVGIRGAALRHVADPPADADRVGDQVAAGDRGGAGGGFEQRGQHAQRRRLAGAVGAEEADDLTGLDVEVDPDDGVDLLLALAEGAGEPAGVDHVRQLAHGHRQESSEFAEGRRQSVPVVALVRGCGAPAAPPCRCGPEIGPATRTGRAAGWAPSRPRRRRRGRRRGRSATSAHSTGTPSTGHCSDRSPSQSSPPSSRTASHPAVHSPSRRAERGSRRATVRPASSRIEAAGRQRLVEQPDEPVGHRLVRRPRGQPAGEQVEALDVGGDVGPPQRMGEEPDLLPGPLGAHQRPLLQVRDDVVGVGAPVVQQDRGVLPDPVQRGGGRGDPLGQVPVEPQAEVAEDLGRPRPPAVADRRLHARGRPAPRPSGTPGC